MTEFSMGRVLTRVGQTAREQFTLVAFLAVTLGGLPNGLTAYLQVARGGPGLVLSLLAGGFGLVGVASICALAVTRSEGQAVTLDGVMNRVFANLHTVLALQIFLSLAIAVGVVLLVAPGLYAATIWSVALPNLLVRGGLNESFSESARLTKGSRWQILGLLLTAWVTTAISAVVLILPATQTGQPLLIAAANCLNSTIQLAILGLLPASIFHELWWGPRSVAPEAVAETFD